MTSETPPQVAQTAAITDALPMNELALIGLFNKPDGSTALIRTAGGAIITLTEGHQTDGYAITYGGLRHRTPDDYGLSSEYRFFRTFRVCQQCPTVSATDPKAANRLIRILSFAFHNVCHNQNLKRSAVLRLVRQQRFFSQEAPSSTIQ